jgi:diguanylate cyclase (GGDEF)-like protein/PAS domain S-box-containing protein
VHTGISKPLAVALAALCVVIVLNGAAAYYNISRLVQAERWVTHTLEVRQAATELLEAVVTAEAAQRGYVLTDNPSFVAQHDDAHRKAIAAEHTLRALTRDNPDQQRRLDDLAAHVSDKLSWTQHVIGMKQQSGPDATLAAVNSGRGPALLARVREAVDELYTQENTLLSERNAEASDSLRATMLGVAVFTLASAVLAILVAYGMRRDLRNRQAAEKHLFEANQMLRVVLDTIPQRVFWKDRESRYLGANRLFAHDQGCERPEDLVGKTDGETDAAPLAAAYREDDLAVMEGNAERLGYEEQLIRGDGSISWLETSKVALRDLEGNVVGMLGTYHDITGRKAAEQQLEHQANFDALTGLPNRNLLADRIRQEIAHAKRTRGVFAMAVLDLDHFKLANDGHGHPFGDRLLVEAARRIQLAIRAEDTIARYGGDEFVLLLSCRGDERFASILERVLESMSAPFHIDGIDYFCTCSIGASTFPQDGIDAATLLSHADAAMYRAKEAGRNRFEVFETAMGNRIRERISLERGLRAALDEGQLFLDYQPQLDLATGRVEGVEALARWKDPDNGLIPPGRFIPVAEQSGLIVPIGAWILRTACAQAKLWLDQGLGPLTVAVNLSALQFRQKGFTEFVARTLAETKLPARHLELEITESLLMSEAEDALAVLTELKAMGICLSIDDFGTGYSSLSYLRRLPVDKLKIDQSFVRHIPDDAGDNAIARAIVSLAASLDLRVIAEGVETAAQCDFLRGISCDEIQGYYFSRPLAADRVADFIRAHAAPSTGAISLKPACS